VCGARVRCDLSFPTFFGYKLIMTKFKIKKETTVHTQQEKKYILFKGREVIDVVSLNGQKWCFRGRHEVGLEILPSSENGIDRWNTGLGFHRADPSFRSLDL